MGTLLLALLLSTGAAAQPGSAALSPSVQAARLVGRAFELVAAPPRRAAADEERRFRVERAGHRLLGAGFNVTETEAILALMEDWLKRSPEAKAAAAPVDELLQRAARSAHPAIRDGEGERGARNWARFVHALADAP